MEANIVDFYTGLNAPNYIQNLLKMEEEFEDTKGVIIFRISKKNR